jgi:magnesium-transporting ATPase (P-type)
MYAELVPSIAFGLSAIIVIFLSDRFFIGGTGWVKSFRSKNLLTNKKAGFVWFLLSALILAGLAIIIEGMLRDWMTDNPIVMVETIVLTIVGAYIYYCDKYHFKWF